MAEEGERAAEFWRGLFTEGMNPEGQRYLRLLKALPREPRCKICKAPFEGIGAPIARLLFHKRRSNINPRFCSTCEDIPRRYQGGAEVEMSMLFADVRGSTTLSELMTPTAFSSLINRFYVEATRVLVEADALIDKLAGDAVAAFWGAGFAGKDYARRTIGAAQDLLRVTGHADPEGPWVPVGVGVHTGTAFFGSVGTPDGLSDITALGDEVNLAARLGASAQTGEILVSEPALRAAGMDPMGLPARSLQLKGLDAAVPVRVMRVGSPNP
jgi:adenylate cyclase